MYVLYPVYGWCWLTAPWLWGAGPMPYFGVVGPRYYVWFGVGFGHWYGFGPHYRLWGWSGRGYWGRGGWVGVGGPSRVWLSGRRTATGAAVRQSDKPYRLLFFLTITCCRQ